MGALHRKLHEQRGASMLMALFMLLVALMVSAVVIAAASAAATLRSDKAQEQASLAVSSAAEYVRDAFVVGGKMNGSIIPRWAGGASYSSDSDGAFRDFVSYAIPELYRNQNALPRRTYRLRLSGDDAVEDVWADFEMSFGQNENTEYPTYILTVTLRNWETTPGEHPCSMTLLLCSNLGSNRRAVTWDGYNVIQR